jgi:hypothetical protein
LLSMNWKDAAPDSTCLLSCHWQTCQSDFRVLGLRCFAEFYGTVSTIELSACHTGSDETAKK